MNSRYELKVLQPHIDPCSENWENMLPHEKGAFCESCNKAVHDLSHFNAEQLAAFGLAHQNEAICARISGDLVDKPIITLKKLPQQYSYTHLYTLMLFFVFGTTLFSCDEKEHEIIKSKIENTFFDNVAVERTTQEKKSKNVAKKQAQFEAPKAEEAIFIPDSMNIVLDPVIIKSNVKTIYGEFVSVSGAFVCMIVEKRIDILENNEEATNKKSEIEKQVEVEKLKVYPNPARFSVTLAYNLQVEESATLSVFNIQGAKISDVFSSDSVIPGPYTSQLDVQNLPAGMYIAILVNGQNKEVFKFNVVH